MFLGKDTRNWPLPSTHLLPGAHPPGAWRGGTGAGCLLCASTERAVLAVPAVCSFCHLSEMLPCPPACPAGFGPCHPSAHIQNKRACLLQATLTVS